MNVRDRLKQLQLDNYIVKHKIFPEGVEILHDDWIRIYKSKGNSCIDEMVYSCDLQDINKIPDKILDMEYDYEKTYFIGADLSLDLMIKLEDE